MTEIREEYFELWLEDGVVKYRYHKGIIIDMEMAEKLVQYRLKLIEGKTYPGFVDARETVYIYNGAKKYLASDIGFIGTSAVAILIKSHVQKILGNTFILLKPAKIPVKLFTEEDKALQWLEDYK
ncbi:hypothetical protein CHU_1676 [Sporocytophaga myxococcoides]|uniref:DUF7793 domain-containing protein n=1 Tax=Sporocytophaga myxococcoides TaxID=153721 RepID=A0A098L908_9BACT|nr:hypothetical protein [Sporocytophaga myxococcoides]GAL83351.1 hypothetical protein CHU_1676 [Sporocytophaga myxococcoides]